MDSLYGTLTLLRLDGSTRATFPLTNLITTFGRLQECDVRIVLPSVSKLHAKLIINQSTQSVSYYIIIQHQQFHYTNIVATMTDYFNSW